MFKIGEFSKLTQIPVKTLRYYDELGLLKPVEVDRFTGYRYYSAGQLPRLNRVLALKDLGFSLEQIFQLIGFRLDLRSAGLAHLVAEFAQALLDGVCQLVSLVSRFDFFQLLAIFFRMFLGLVLHPLDLLFCET